MFGAKVKGHGKAKLLSILGMQRMKQICDELGEGGEFKCKKVFGTGAIGTVRPCVSSVSASLECKEAMSL